MSDIIGNGEWAISIHDAGLVLPGTGIRKSMTNRLEQLRLDRHTILNNYHKSIGIDGPLAEIAFNKVLALTEQLDPSVPFAKSSLK